MDFLTRQEEIYLLAIWRLQDNAYGVQIKKKITEITGKVFTYGTLYFTLEQLFKKEYVSREAGNPTPVRGGCSKIFYHLTEKGIEGLKNAHKLQQTIWEGITIQSLDQEIASDTK